MEKIIKKLIQSLYCVNIPCVVWGKPISVKVWRSFRDAGTYFCRECSHKIVKAYNSSKFPRA